MTVAEMIIGVNLGVQKVDSNAYDNLLDEEILYYLNKSSREYVRRQAVYLQEDVENISRVDLLSSSKAANNLATILTTSSFSGVAVVASGTYDNAVEVDISGENIFLYVYGQATSTGSGETIACKKISPFEIKEYVKTEYNNPVFRRYPLIQIGSQFVVFFDGRTTDIDDLTVVYLAPPATLTVGGNDSDLPVHTHDDIVDITVGMILEDIRSRQNDKIEQKTINHDT